MAPDPAGARERLESGQRHLAEAEQLLRLGSPDVTLLLAEAALVNGADALLRLHGFQVQSHAARFAYPSLPFAYSGNPGLLAQIRITRNATQYEAAVVSGDLACEALRLARGALTAAAGGGWGAPPSGWCSPPPLHPGGAPRSCWRFGPAQPQ